MSSSSVEPPLDRTASHTRNLTLCNGERNGWVHLLDKNKRIPPPQPNHSYQMQMQTSHFFNHLPTTVVSCDYYKAVYVDRLT